MIVENGILKLNKIELIDILENNPQKTLENENIKKILIEIINKYGNHTSQKQFNWILSKLNFILKTNKKYKEKIVGYELIHYGEYGDIYSDCDCDSDCKDCIRIVRKMKK